MYFYLSKTLGDIAVPSTFVPLVIVVGALLWRSRFAAFGRRLTAIGVLLLVIGGISPIGTALLLPLEDRFPQWNESGGAPTGIVVLGGVINTHISLRRKTVTVNQAASRLIAAVELYRRYPAIRIIFSGGNSSLVPRGEPEAVYARRLLEDLGVPASQIAIDTASRNTVENAINAKAVAEAKPGERWLLVTSALHMPRAIGLFRAAGFPVEAYPVDYRTSGWKDLLALPSLSQIGGFVRLDNAVHEWEGLLVDWLIGRSKKLFPRPED